MDENSKKTVYFQAVIAFLIPALVLHIGGCGDFLNDKPAEIESDAILNDIEQFRENPNIKNQLPELYRQQPKRVEIEDGVKLFYFTRQHTPNKLASIISKQLGYKTDVSLPTNQLIIHCSNHKEADKTLEFLSMVDVQPIQVNIDCIIIERYADKTMDRETTIKIDNLLGEKITMGGKVVTDTLGNILYEDESFVNSNGETVKIPKLLPNFPGASLRESKRATFGMDVGYWRNKGIDGHEARALIDILESKGYLKILMNPTLETVNGQRAMITSRDDVPVEKIVTQNDTPYSITEYQWVEDSLEVTPHVYADGSIGLSTHIKVGSSSKPQGVVQASVITERSIVVEENRIEPGKSLIIGGIRTTEKREVIRGAPFFKDLPVIGLLFSSKDFEESANELIFILTPTISSGGIKYAEMMKNIKEKQEPVKYNPGIETIFTDPFGTSAYTEHIEHKASKAEFERFKSELETAQALDEIDIIKQKLIEADEIIIEEKNKVSLAQQELKQARRNAEQARQQAEEARTQAEKAMDDAKKTELNTQIANDEAEDAESQNKKSSTKLEKNP